MELGIKPRHFLQCAVGHCSTTSLQKGPLAPALWCFVKWGGVRGKNWQFNTDLTHLSVTCTLIHIHTLIHTYISTHTHHTHLSTYSHATHLYTCTHQTHTSRHSYTSHTHQHTHIHHVHSNTHRHRHTQSNKSVERVKGFGYHLSFLCRKLAVQGDGRQCLCIDVFQWLILNAAHARSWVSHTADTRGPWKLWGAVF